MTVQPDLLSWTPAPQSILGPRDGITYDEAKDRKRLDKQSQACWQFMADEQWHVPREIESATGYSWASINARLRDWRKEKHGGHTVLRERLSQGLFRYKLIPNRGKA
jgi:hypothetical protein